MRFTRRVTVVLACAASLAGAAAAAAIASSAHGGAARAARDTSLPVKQMENILQASGTVTNGVLSVEYERTDINGVKIGSTPIDPQFEINGTLTFQPIGNGQAFLNGDLALKPSELDPFIEGLVNHGIHVQAEHQHMYDFDPMVWFVHMRSTGDALHLARTVHDVIASTTATPLPQPPPSPHTPFDAERLKNILHGYDAEVSDGVVTVFVARKTQVTIAGVQAKPQANIATNIAFEPLDSSGTQAAVMPDFALVANEINPVFRLMRQNGWDIGCLYNQETAERPQLYFSHQFKTGDPYELAHEIRAALDLMDSQ